MINSNVLEALLRVYAEDSEALEMIDGALQSFSLYHAAIYRAETWKRVYSVKAVDAETYRTTVTEQDKQRTVCHNAVLANVRMLNRMAALAKLEPIYAGEVSEERPYRREVANSVLDYVETVIKNRA